MGTRIYSLAKELRLDTKELVDICTKAGISGKGSALATLTDDEVEKVKGFLTGGGPKTKRSKAAPPAPEPPKRSPTLGKMRVIVSSASKAAPEPPTPAEPPPPEVQEPAPAVADVAAEAVEEVQAEAEPAPAPPADVAAERVSGPVPLRREDYIGPGAGTGKMPVIGGGKAPAKKDGNGGAPPSRSRPTVKLAPVPAAGKPAPKPKTEEPTPQKPDMKLPADVMRAHSSGQSRPLAAHLRRAERVAEATKRQQDGVKARQEEPARETTERRGKKKGRAGKETGKDQDRLLGREQRQLRRRLTSNRQQDDDRTIRRITRRNRRAGSNTAAPRKEQIVVELPCTVRELSEAAGVPAAQIVRILMSEGVMANINATLEPDLAELVAADLGVDVQFRHAVTLEEEVLARIRDSEDDPAELKPRAPVITFLGHVDHGKTSLLDKILGVNVVGGESGGITQHIRAYQIDHEGRKISFVDTPGHEAFTEMRARGANVTDIAVLVVAADDGVMPQTEEAISHARAAEVPIVVALNKIDLPGVDQNQALTQLSSNDLLPSEWGGDVEVVRTSATTGDGVDNLLETLLTVAELHEYKANPQRTAYGTTLEAQQEAGRGIVAKLIVENGTLRVGDVIVCGEAFGKVKAMEDTLQGHVRVLEAGPSTPVNVIGLDVAPEAGEHFYVLDDVAQARQIAEARADQTRLMQLSGSAQHVTLENLWERLEGAEEVQTLNVILRADVRGSIEAIEKEFTKLEHPEVRIKVLQATVGGVTEADVTLADASDAIIIGFNVVPDEHARQLAERKGVQIRRYDVIYKITDDLKKALEGLLKPEEREVDLGRALVQQSYKISRVGTVAGCRVLAGTVERNSRARVIRDNTIIGDYPVESLRREKDDAREVREGFECGIKLAGFNDIKEADLLEVYRVEEVGRSFDE